MATAPGDVASGVPLQDSRAVEASRHQGHEGEPGHRCNYKTSTVALAVVSLILLIAVIAQAASSGRSPAVLGLPAGPCCPDSWIGYQRKCYYFSEAEGNWDYSQSQCSALNASLAAIDSDQEMAFLKRCKGKPDHWIGLRRDSGKPWKWANGTEFNNVFPITGDGDCAYLSEENGVSGLRCISGRRWICSKLDGFTKAKEVAR